MQLEQAMAAVTTTPATLRRYARRTGEARARGRLRLARPRRGRRCAGSASPTRELDRPLETFSGGELTRASLARALARRPRPAAARRADEPPRRREPRMARAGAPVARRRGDPRRARPLVPRGRHDRRARARGRPLAVLPGPVARLAAGEGGARVGRREDRGASRRRTSSGSNASWSGSATRSRRRSRRRPS